MTGRPRENELRRWVSRFRAAVGLAWAVWPDRVAAPGTWMQTFRDGAGHRRDGDEPFLRAFHNLGRPDRFSAHIFGDAADELDAVGVQ